MRVDLSLTFDDIDGEKVVRSEADRTPVTLGYAAALSLGINHREDSPDEKYHKGKLRLRILAAENASESLISLKAKEIEIVKKAIGEAYGPVIVTPAFDALEGESDSDSEA